MIINSQRNSNTLVQASSLNGGNLAQSFNLQGMSIINGYFHLIPPKYTNSDGQNANQSILLNEATGNPILLPVGACIISIVICTNELITSPYEDIIYCTIAYGKTPTYNYSTNIWEPTDNIQIGQSILDFRLSQLQTGIYSTPFSNAINAYSCLIAFIDYYYNQYYKSISPPDAICKVKLLIINPTLAQ